MLLSALLLCFLTLFEINISDCSISLSSKSALLPQIYAFDFKILRGAHKHISRCRSFGLLGKVEQLAVGSIMLGVEDASLSFKCQATML